MPDARAPGHLTLLLGGARSGKSDRAQALAAAGGGRVLFVATAEALDDDMARRIARHRAARPAGWETLEAPRALPEAVAEALTRATPDVVIVDCLTLWVSNLLLAHPDAAEPFEPVARAAGARLLDVVRGAPVRWIVVSNEVGLGVVPGTALGRDYRDALGRVNRMVAAAADVVTLMVAGIPVPVRG